jgi:hypothetical protein
MTPSRRLTHALVLGLTVAALTVATTVPAAADGNAERREQIRIGRLINPVELRPRPAALRDTVYLGSYLVNTGGCNDCHTNPPYAAGGDPFLGEPEQVNTVGYMGGGQQFGPFTSPNLTPDEDGLPAGLTFPEFRQVMRTGVDLKHAHPEFGPLLQVMPWPVYSKKTTEEIYAIYQYLKSIPSLPNP